MLRGRIPSLKDKYYAVDSVVDRVLKESEVEEEKKEVENKKSKKSDN